MRLWVCLLHAVLTQLITFAIRPNLSYGVLDAGGSTGLLGVVAAAFAIPALLLALPVGHAVDRVGERPAMLAGAVMMGTACVVAISAPGSLVALVLATAFFGCGHLLSVVGDQTVMANLPGGRSLDARFGWYGFATAIGQILGPLLLTLPGSSGPGPPVVLVFSVCAGLAIMLMVVSASLASSVIDRARNSPGLRSETTTLLRSPGFVPAMMASSVVLASIDLFVAYLPAIGHQAGIAVASVSVILAVRSAATMVSRLCLMPLTSAVGRRRLFISSLVMSALSLIAFALPLSVALMVVVAAIYGFFVGTCQPITMSWVSEIAPAGSRALAMSLRVAGNRAGQTTLPPVIGAFAVAAGAGGVLAVVGVVLFFSAWTGRALEDPSPRSHTG